MRTNLAIATPLLVFAAFAGCGGAPVRTATPTPTAVAAPASAPTVAEVPILLRVYTRYDDFSGHGYNASGQWYRQIDGMWQSARCQSSHIADPEAGRDGPPNCGAWAAVPNAQWPAIDAARAASREFACSERATLCHDLGLAAETDPLVVTPPAGDVVAAPPLANVSGADARAPRIMYWFGKVNQHFDVASRRWLTDPDGTSGADVAMLDYCRRWYPQTSAVRPAGQETIATWRSAGNTGAFTATQPSYLCVQ